MRIICIFYTHNQIKPELLRASVNSIDKMLEVADLNSGHLYKVVATAWEDIPGWKHELYFSRHREKGHLNICIQLLSVLYEKESYFDYVVFLEHDILYAGTYLLRIGRLLQFLKDQTMENLQEHIRLHWSPPQWIINYEYIGMNGNGYQTARPDRCLSQSAMRMDFAIQNLERSQRDCIRQGWCYLEPQGVEPVVLPPSGMAPNVHVNMNETEQNHHLTNHYSLYNAPDTAYHPFWGDFREFKIF